MSEKTAPSKELATLRRDHVAGAAFIVAGVFLWAVSGDLPFGTLASPGAGMLPKLVIALMVGFACHSPRARRRQPTLRDPALGRSPARGARRRGHGWRHCALHSVSASSLTMALLLFGLTFAIERKPLLNSLLFSAGVTGIAYVLFNTLLKSPLPRGVLWF